MDEQTRSIIQNLLDTISSNTQDIARLQAFNAVSSFVMMEVLSRSDSFTDTPSEILDAYMRVRESALGFAEIGGSKDDFQVYLNTIDRKFMGIYE